MLLIIIQRTASEVTKTKGERKIKPRKKKKKQQIIITTNLKQCERKKERERIEKEILISAFSFYTEREEKRLA